MLTSATISFLKQSPCIMTCYLIKFYAVSSWTVISLSEMRVTCYKLQRINCIISLNWCKVFHITCSLWCFLRFFLSILLFYLGACRWYTSWCFWWLSFTPFLCWCSESSIGLDCGSRCNSLHLYRIFLYPSPSSWGWQSRSSGTRNTWLLSRSLEIRRVRVPGDSSVRVKPWRRSICMRWKVRFPAWCTCRGPCWRSADFWSRWFRPQCVCGRRRWSPPSICAWPESTRLRLGDGSAWIVMYGEVFWEEGKGGLSLYNWLLLHVNVINTN